jgi:tetratricopeptide (TPR) repeat protein
MLALLRVCDAIADPGKSADRAKLPIGTLARIGEVNAALSHVDAHLKRLPPSAVLEVVRMAELGAEICIDSENLARMEHYLAIAAATEPFNTRKCDRGFSIDSVRKFRARGGLLDPAEAVGEQERIEATFQRAGRTFRASLDARDIATARRAAETMARAATEERHEWWRTQYLKTVIAAFADLDDVAAVRRHLELIDPDDRGQAIKTDVLVRLGMEAEALPRLREAMKRSLAAAADPSDPNTHIPVSEFARALVALYSLGAREEAQEWLRNALVEHARWTTPEAGWSTTAIAQSLAEAASALGETVIARQLLAEAMGEAKQEHRSSHRNAAVESVLRSPANAGMTQAAIDEARRIRSPTGRRKTLACLLAGARRWDELREVLDSIDTAEEAADVVWWLHFKLPESMERGFGR